VNASSWCGEWGASLSDPEVLETVVERIHEELVG
jgi:hypothetical protein